MPFIIEDHGLSLSIPIGLFRIRLTTSQRQLTPRKNRATTIFTNAKLIVHEELAR